MTRARAVAPVAPVALLALLAAALHWRELRGEPLYERDVHQLLLPIKHFVADCLRHGELPQWWPYDGGGSPLLAQPIAGVFHPTQLLALVLPFWTAFALTNLLATFFAGLGAYALARTLGQSRTQALVAGGAFLASGCLVSMTEFVFAKLAVAAMPWYAATLVSSHRRPGASLVLPPLMMALVLVGGDPQFALLSSAFGALLLFLNPKPTFRTVVQAVASPLVGATVAAVQVLPAWLLAPLTERGADMAVRERWVLGAHELAAFVWPVDLRPDALYGSLFLGLPLLALAFASFARARRRPLVAGLWLAVGLSLWTAAGERAGLQLVWRALVPTWSQYRYPLKTVVVAVLALALLAGEGLRALQSARSRRVAMTWALAGALAAGVGAALVVGVPSEVPFVSALGALALVVWSARRGWMQRFTGASAVTIILAASTFPTLPHITKTFYDPGPMVDVLRREGVGLNGASFERSNALEVSAEERAAAQAAGAGGGVTDFNALFDLPTLAPALPGASARLRRLEEHPDVMSERLDGAFGVGVMVLESQQVDQRLRPRVVGMEPQFGWTAVRLRRSLPRAYATRNGKSAADADEASREVLSPDFQPGREVVLEGGWEEAWGRRPREPAREETVVARTNTTVDVAADLPWDGFIVLNEASFPGWRVTVDEAPAPLLIANAVMRAVAVRAGNHRVRFSYETPGLFAGTLVSLAALVALGLFVLRARRRPRPS